MQIQYILIRLLQAILCLGFVLLIHELGHLIAARIVGVRVQKFSVFVSPFFSLVRWKPGSYLKFFVTTKKSKALVRSNIKKDLQDFNAIKPKNWKDTEYVLGWLPIAGYCKFDTQYSTENSQDGHLIYPSWDFRNLHPGKRLFVNLAGVIANIICAAAVFFCLDFFEIKQAHQENDTRETKENSNPMVVYSPYAQKVGFRNDDQILMADTFHVPDAVAYLETVLNAKSVKVLRMRDTITINVPQAFRDSIFSETDNKKFNYYFIYYPYYPCVLDVLPNSIADSLGIKRGDYILDIDSISMQSTSQYFYEAYYRVDSLVTFTFARFTPELELEMFKHSFVLPRKYPFAGMKLAYYKNDYFKISEENHKEEKQEPNSVNTAISTTAKITAGAAKSIVSPDDNEDKDKFAGIVGWIRLFPDSWDWHFWWLSVAISSIGMAVFNVLPIPGLDGGQALVCLWEMVFGRKMNETVLGLINIIGLLFVLALMIWDAIRGIRSLF